MYKPGTFVDLSSDDKFDSYFSPSMRRLSGLDEGTSYVDLEACKRSALAFDEVIFGLKGMWWYPFAQVIDPNTGLAMSTQRDGQGDHFGRQAVPPPKLASSQLWWDPPPSTSTTAPPQPASSHRTEQSPHPSNDRTTAASPKKRKTSKGGFQQSNRGFQPISNISETR